MRLSMRLGLSMTGGLYRPVYWTFHRGSGSLSWPAGVGRPAESLDSGFGECPLGTRTSFRSPVRLTGVLAHVSESFLWRPTEGTPHRIRRLRLSRDFLPRPSPDRFPILRVLITALSSLPHPPTKTENSA